MEQKRRGRPTKAPEDGERVSLGLRVTADIKRRLDQAAAASGRSQSQEAELRIERSFHSEDALTAALGGPELRSHALGLVAAFACGGESEAHGRPPAKWLKDPDAYQAALIRVLKVMLPDVPSFTVETAKHLHAAFEMELRRALVRAGKLKFDFGDGLGPMGSGWVAPKPERDVKPAKRRA